MAQSRRRKPKKDRRKSGATGSRDPRVAVVPVPHLKPLYKLLSEVTATADRLILSTPDEPDRLVRFDTEILVRAINSVKSVRLLLEGGHWEHASGIIRQLFELLVNMEYLGKQPDRLEATLLYCRFGMLQLVREQHRRCLYNRDTGRPVDKEHLAFLEKLLDESFDDFQGLPRADGSVRWVSSWSRKSTKALSDLSDDAMRPHQYEHLFTSWSEQAHAAPRSLIENIFRDAGEDWVSEAMESDTKKVIEAANLTVAMFVALWRELPHAVPLPAEQANSWMRTTMQFMAVPDFDDLPGYRTDK
ncbi:DUF5677 domain-containing protein [Streptomyces sp. FR-108]|uniref:DUF5677 domain-containing protein n=1 Tax=Streptomyces sp. FR-108 TaxID=3416665 RepID=UPI003CF304B2